MDLPLTTEENINVYRTMVKERGIQPLSKELKEYFVAHYDEIGLLKEIK